MFSVTQNDNQDNDNQDNDNRILVPNQLKRVI